MPADIPITSYFSRVPKRKKKDARKRKRTEDSEASNVPSKKANKQVPAKPRIELRDRTSSMNKLMDATPETVNETTPNATVSPQTPPYFMYATPKSLMKRSASTSDPSPRKESNFVELEKDRSLDSTRKEGDDPFLSDATVHKSSTPRPLIPNKALVEPLTPSSPVRSTRNSTTSSSSQTAAQSSSVSHTAFAKSTSPLLNTPVRSGKGRHFDDEIVPETPERPSLLSERNMSYENLLDDQVPISSQVPSSQSQEVEANLLLEHDPLDKAQSQSENVVIPSSQSQEVPLCDVSLEEYKRRMDSLKQIREKARQSLADIVPSSQSQIEHELGPLSPTFPWSKPLSTHSDISHDLNGDLVKPCSGTRNQSHQELQRSDSSESFIVPIEDVDILSMFEDDDTLQAIGFGLDDHQAVEVLPENNMPLPGAVSVTESESGDEGAVLPPKQSQTRSPSPLQTQSSSSIEAHEIPVDNTTPPVLPETQSWQSDVSGYSLPQVAKDFFAMLEAGPDAGDDL